MANRLDELPRVPYDDMVEEALCFGWVDSLARKLDEDRSMLLPAQRKPGSAWSRPNKERVARRVAGGAMTAAGLAKVDAAKADGTWTKLHAVEALTVPKDLAAAFRRHAGAAANFAAFPRSAKRVRETAELAARSVRANRWQPK